MKTGPKGKPTLLKLISGTARADRMLPNQPDARGTIGEAPDYFNEQQRACWNDAKSTAPDGLLTACDRNLFEGYAVLLAARIVAVKSYNQTHMAILMRSDQSSVRHIGNPYLKEIRRLTDQLMRIESEFGFTPAARTRISLPTGEGFADPLSKFV